MLKNSNERILDSFTSFTQSPHGEKCNIFINYCPDWRLLRPVMRAPKFEFFMEAWKNWFFFSSAQNDTILIKYIMYVYNVYYIVYRI